MHEMSIAQSLTDGIRGHLPPGAVLLRAVVDVGPLEHIDEDTFQTAWTASTTSPPLAGARLEIHWTPVRVRCRACGHEHSPDRTEYLVCPECGQARPEVLEGWGVILRTLEADVLEPEPTTSAPEGFEER